MLVSVDMVVSHILCEPQSGQNASYKSYDFDIVAVSPASLCELHQGGRHEGEVFMLLI